MFGYCLLVRSIYDYRRVKDGKGNEDLKNLGKRMTKLRYLNAFFLERKLALYSLEYLFVLDVRR